MTEKRLNDLMVLNIHKEKTDLLNLAVVAKEFVSSRENRVQLFGNCFLFYFILTGQFNLAVCYHTLFMILSVISNTHLNCLHSHFGGRRHTSLGRISHTTPK